MNSNLDIICVSGGMTDSTTMPIWRHFPKPMRAHIHFRDFDRGIDQLFAFDAPKWQNLIYDLVQNVRGRPVILVGHSQGGAVACCVAALANAGTVLGVVTIFTPHLMFSLQPWLLPMPYTINVPIVSFHGTLDTHVWCGTEHARSVAHEDLISDHMGLAHDHKHAERIVAVARKHFSL